MCREAINEDHTGLIYYPLIVPNGMMRWLRPDLIAHLIEMTSTSGQHLHLALGGIRAQP